MVRERAGARGGPSLGALRDAFVRVLVLPAEWAGKRTIRYVEPVDDTGPRQSASILLEHAIAPPTVTRSGGRILVDQLELHGAELAFGVPGESYIDVLDALRDSSVRFVTCRHEAGAANMAEAYGKLTNRPGLCLVTRGPGATHAAVGVHTAFQDGTPLILLVGQIPREDVEREAFQELDYRRVFGSLAKWVAQVDQVERIPELLARAFRVATSGTTRPGRARPPGGRARRRRGRAGRVGVRARAGRARCGRARAPCARRSSAPSDRSSSSEGSRGRAEAGAALARWCEASGIPVAASWRAQDYVRERLRAATPAISGSGSTRRFASVSATLTSCSSSAPASASRDGRLRDDRPARRRTDAHPHPSRPERARPRLRAGARHRRLRASLRERPGAAGAPGRDAGARERSRPPVRSTSPRSRAVRCRERST